MSPAAEHLRARIVVAPTQGLGRRRYGAELKRAVVEYAFAREGERATIREIAEELGLSAGVLGRWLRHARLRLKNGKIPFEPGEPPSMLDPQRPAAEPTAAGFSSSQAVPCDAGPGSAPG
jgi:transposase-like protein